MADAKYKRVILKLSGEALSGEQKFGLDFVIVDSAQMAQTRRTYGLAANPFRLFPRVIVSMAWLSSVRAQRLFRDVLADYGRTVSFDPATGIMTIKAINRPPKDM